VENDEDSLVDEFPQFFSIRIQYLDLSCLGLENKPLHIPLLLLIHQEYDVISDLLNQCANNFSGSAIISGQPGTGEVTIVYPC